MKKRCIRSIRHIWAQKLERICTALECQRGRDAFLKWIDEPFSIVPGARSNPKNPYKQGTAEHGMWLDGYLIASYADRRGAL